MTTDEKRHWAATFPVHVGVDTAKKFHKLVAAGPDRARQPAQRVLVSRAGFDGAHAYLQAHFPGIAPAQVLVGLEFAGHHGFTFAHDLARRGYQVVNVLPSATKATKAVETNSRNKSDDVDARQICRLVGDGVFVRFPFLQSPYLELKLLTMQRHRLTVECTRYKNRLQGLLDLGWPEFARLYTKIDQAAPIALLERWPLPEDLLRAAPRTVQRHVHAAARGHVKPEKIRALVQSARETVALPEGTGERRREIQHLLARWRLAREQMAELEAAIEALAPACPEVRALMTVPEVGAVCAATLVAELGTPQDYDHPRQILKLAGMNLDGRDTANTVGRKHMSKRGRPMLRRQLYLLAGRWSLERGLYHADHAALKARYHGLGTKAICTLARRLVPLLFAVMKTGEPFDEARWRANRHQPQGAPRPSDTKA
jgi:transposase